MIKIMIKIVFFFLLKGKCINQKVSFERSPTFYKLASKKHNTSELKRDKILNWRESASLSFRITLCQHGAIPKLMLYSESPTFFQSK